MQNMKTYALQMPYTHPNVHLDTCCIYAQSFPEFPHTCEMHATSKCGDTYTCTYGLTSCIINMCAAQSKLPKVAVWCKNNTSIQNDGQVWLELFEPIMEHNGRLQLNCSMYVTVFREGDVVKVRAVKSNKFWNGIVAFLCEESPVTTKEPVK